MFKQCIRYGAYPVVFGLSALAVWLTIHNGIAAWPSFAMFAGLALFVIARM